MIIHTIQRITCTVQAWQLVGLEEIDLNNLLVLMAAHTEQNLPVVIFFGVYQGCLNIGQIREEFQNQFVCLEAQNVKLIKELLWKRNTVSLIVNLAAINNSKAQKKSVRVLGQNGRSWKLPHCTLYLSVFKLSKSSPFPSAWKNSLKLCWINLTFE